MTLFEPVSFQNKSEKCLVHVLQRGVFYAQARPDTMRAPIGHNTSRDPAPVNHGATCDVITSQRSPEHGTTVAGSFLVSCSEGKKKAFQQSGNCSSVLMLLRWLFSARG